MKSSPGWRLDGLRGRSPRRPVAANARCGAVRVSRAWSRRWPRDLEREALGRLGRLRDLVFSERESLLAAEDPKIRLATADLVLRQGLAYRTAFEQDQLRMLETRVARITAGLDPDANSDDDDDDDADWDSR